MSKPSAKEIVELYEELRTENFSGQSDEDTKAQNIVTQKHIVEMNADPNFPAKAVGTGYGALVTKQNYAFLATLPFTRFNAPKETQKEHAEMLEQANEAMWKASGARRAWLRATNDAATVGRGWMSVYASPKRWSGDEFKKGPSESEKDYLSRLTELKLTNFPIVVSHVDYRDCWPTYDEMGEVDQTTRHHKLSIRQIRRQYGISLEGTDREKVDVYLYTDDKWALTAIKDREGYAREFEHGLGMNPLVPLEMPILPDNDEGLRWAGSVFDLRHLIPEMDGAFSDWRHQTKRQTHSQTVYELQLEERRQHSPDAKSNADLITLTPDGDVVLNVGEKVYDQFTQGMVNPDLLGFLNFATALTKENAIRPVLLGILEQGGDSGVRYNTGAQLAQGSFGPAIENLKLSAEGITRRLLASVTALSKDFSDITDADKVPVIYADGKGGSKTIEIGPKDVAGWGAPGTIQARIELNIPINENAEIVTGRLAADRENGLMDEEQAMERFGHIENPRATKHKRRLDRIERAMDDSLIQFVQMRGMQLQSQPGTSPNVLQQRLAALPPQVRQAVQMAHGVPEARGEAGRAQTGLPQALSMTEGTKLKGQPSE